MDRRWAPLLLAAVIGAVGPGCSSKKPPPVVDGGTAKTERPPMPPPPSERPKTLANPVFALIPKKAALALVIPNLGETVKQVGRQLRGPVGQGGWAKRILDSMRRLSLGLVDLSKAAHLKRWGLAADRAVAVALDPEAKRSVFIVGLSSREKFEKALGEYATAAGIKRQRVGGQEVLLVSKSGKPSFAASVKKDFVLMVPAADPKAPMGTFLAVREAESLAGDRLFLATSSKLGRMDHALFFLRGEGLYHLQTSRRPWLGEHEKTTMRRTYETLRAIAVGVSLGGAKPELRGYVSIGSPEGWSKVFSARARFPLGAHLTQHPIAVGRFGISGQALVERMLSIDPATKRKLIQLGDNVGKRLGIHLDRDVLHNLDGQVAAAFLGFAPDLGSAIGDSAKRAGLLGKLRLVAAVSLKDAARFQKVLRTASRFTATAAAGGLTLTARVVGKHKAYVLARNGGTRLALAVVGSDLLLAFRDADLEAMLSKGTGDGSTVLAALSAAGAKALREDVHAAIHVDSGRLLGALRAVDLGPLGERGKKLAALVEGPVRRLLESLGGVTLTLRFDGEGIVLRALLERTAQKSSGGGR